MSESPGEAADDRDDNPRTVAHQRAERIRRTELAEARATLDGELSETQVRALTELTERLVAELLPDECDDDETWRLFGDDR